MVRGDQCVCELCCVGQIACALPVWQVVLCMLPLYAVGGMERCSQGEVERGARACYEGNACMCLAEVHARVDVVFRAFECSHVKPCD